MSCGIDWAATGSMLSGWGSLLGAGATTFGGIAVLIAANRGVTTFAAWKKERLAERHIVHAEHILSAAYKAQHALNIILASDRSKDESRALEQTNKGRDRIHRDEPKEEIVTQRMYLLRLDDVAPILDDLFNVMPFAKAFWGEELEMELRRLRIEFDKLKAAVEDVSTLVRPFDQSSVIMGVEKAVKAIEAHCIPTLQSVEQG